MIPPQQSQQANVKLRNNHISFGGIFVISGIAMFILNCITLVRSDDLINYKSGIWMGIFIIVGGSFAIIAAKKDNKNCVIGALVMDIFCACLCWLVVIFSSIEITIRQERSAYYRSRTYNFDSYSSIFNKEESINSRYIGFTTIYSIIMLVGMLLGFVLLIVHAGMCCFDICSCCAECCTCCLCCCTPTITPSLPQTSNQAQAITIQPGVPVTNLPHLSQGQVVTFQYPNYQYSQVPSAMPVQYPPAPIPGQYPPISVPGQYPPAPVPGQYPFAPVSNQYPPQPGYNPNYNVATAPSASAPEQPESAAPPPYEEICKQD